MPTAKIISILCLLLLFSACSSKPYLPADINSSLANHRASYQLTLQQEKPSRSLLVLEQKQQNLHLIAMSHAGMTLFVLQRTEQGDKLKKAPFAKVDYSPSQLLNALLLTQYDIEFLQAAMPKNWQITEEKSSTTVRNKGKQLMRIEQSESGTYQVITAEPTMQLQLLSQEPIP